MTLKLLLNLFQDEYCHYPTMEDQKSAFQLFCEENYYSETKGSKTITKAKGERIIKVLTNDPAAADYSPKFRHWVKQRGFKLVSDCH